MEGKERHLIKTGEYYLAIKNKHGVTHAAVGTSFRNITLGRGEGRLAQRMTCLPQNYGDPSWIPRSHALKEHGVVVVPPCFRGTTVSGLPLSSTPVSTPSCVNQVGRHPGFFSLVLFVGFMSVQVLPYM